MVNKDITIYTLLESSRQHDLEANDRLIIQIAYSITLFTMNNITVFTLIEIK